MRYLGFLACFCPCLVYSQNKRRLEHLTKYETPEPMRNAGMCSSDCAIHGALTFLSYNWVLQVRHHWPWFWFTANIAQMGTRASIRTRYRIRGGGCEDCLAAMCCTPCELSQESREIELEEHSLWGWAKSEGPGS